ncbi:MAG: ABC transporter permease [Lentisphaerae bacterium]|jgi:molybdate transport system permease protein|nr:ABC transporter permease [Lentisphaerota bacterium]MBT4816275.1 ABC transporter permease [Lentisphaerota bacterium]MBT5608820.1 ABC transporter permease [Lentisphaerota bacterium]MBT7059980.1 ABC transporter permease [Lentisphaerota bacterium]MBT7840306.1 ABC transporter permease [Lentisphaerota bacterium]
MANSPPNDGRAAERAFRRATQGTVLLAVLMVAGTLVAMAAYVDWPQKLRWACGTPEGRAFAGQVWHSIKLSLITSTTTTLIALLFGIPAAYALSRFRGRFALLIDTIIDLPIVLPPLVAGIALLTVLRYWMGPLFDAIGIQIHYTPKSIVLAQLFIAGPFAVRAVKAAFDDISPRYEAIARTLGCTRARAFLVVVLPLAKNGIIAGTVMTWARAISEFGPILIFCTASEKTAVLPIRVFLQNSAGDIAGGIVTSVILVIVAATALLIFKALGGRRISL